MVCRPLGNTGFELSPIGFGAFKIGRNQGIKYPQGFDLPDDARAHRLLNDILDLGITYFDTAPAYGHSEQRLGQALADRKSEFILSTKVGERFEDGRSTYDFSESGVLDSVARSRERLKCTTLDLVFIHSNGDDLHILRDTEVVPTLKNLRAAGDIKAIGFSGKTVEGSMEAMHWADAIMVEYHLDDRTHEEVIEEAEAREIGIIVKKGLASGHLDPHEAIEFVLSNPGVTSLVIGGLDVDHMRSNLEFARRICHQV